MSDKELLKYCWNLHGRSVIRWRLQQIDEGLHGTLKKRRLLGKIRTIYGTEIRPLGHWSTMTNEGVISEAHSLYGKDVAIGDICRCDRGLYYQLCKRKLLGNFEGHSNTEKKSSIYWKNWKNIKKDLKKEIKRNHGEFPTQTGLATVGKSGLGWAIYKYHGGFAKVRRKMGYKANNENGYYYEWGNFERDLRRSIKLNAGEFPTENRLIELELGHLRHPMSFYGGYFKVREKIGYNETMRVKLARELEEIVGDLI